MEVTVVQETSWSRALDAARRTIGKEPLHKEPSDNWKAKVLLAEHSPIKLVEYCIHFKNLRQWVGIHLLRHEHMLPFIHSQREDRRKLNCCGYINTEAYQKELETYRKKNYDD